MGISIGPVGESGKGKVEYSGEKTGMSGKPVWHVDVLHGEKVDNLRKAARKPRRKPHKNRSRDELGVGPSRDAEAMPGGGPRSRGKKRSQTEMTIEKRRNNGGHRKGLKEAHARSGTIKKYFQKPRDLKLAPKNFTR